MAPSRTVVPVAHGLAHKTSVIHDRAANRTVTAYGRTPTGRYGWVADHHPYRNIEPHIPIRYGMGGHTAVNGSIRAVQVL